MSPVPMPHRVRVRAPAWRWAGWGAAALLLLAPAVAMRFTDEVRWSAGDFAAAALMLGALGAGIEWTMRRGGNRGLRLAWALALVTVFLLLFVNGAVGLIGAEGHPANLLVLAVPAVALIGSAWARGRPRAMAWAMVATAAAQGVLALVAWSAGWPLPLRGTLVFAALWLASAVLFGLDARRARQGG